MARKVRPTAGRLKAVKEQTKTARKGGRITSSGGGSRNQGK